MVRHAGAEPRLQPEHRDTTFLIVLQDTDPINIPENIHIFMTGTLIGNDWQSSQATRGNTYLFGYQYDLAGNLAQQTYPSGRVVWNKYDGAGRIAGVQRQSDGLYYSGAASTDVTNRIQYAPHGGAVISKLGNGLWEQTRFNSRLQPVQIGLGNAATDASSALGTTQSNLMLLQYCYNNANSWCSDVTEANNGDILRQNIWRGICQTYPASDLTQKYQYSDGLNRLTNNVMPVMNI